MLAISSRDAACVEVASPMVIATTRMNEKIFLVFFIFSAIPASVTLVLFAADYDVSPGLVARSVLYSSAAGIFTMACIIQLAQYLFPAGV